ncbi:PIR protein, putative [Plasmodium sp.]|nr:PIR protein, putative [Plasmodium sp.]
MKLHYSRILLFSLPLNILVSSSYGNNKNKPYITPRHTPTTRSRVLSECDLYMSSYDNDPDMKSVKENFDRQTSERFEEYDERIKDKRRKCKEQCDKDIQEIIVKDKINKSLAEKIEKGCLRCGFGLGGVAAGVGIFGAIAVNEVKKAALLAAAQKGIQEGIAKAIEGLGNIYELSEASYLGWAANINETNFSNQNILIAIVNKLDNMCTDVETAKGTLFCKSSYSINSDVTSSSFTEIISPLAAKAARVAGESAKNAERAQIALADTASYNSYIAITYAVISILIILLVMVIIYLILRYRRKKKMNKKQQYTKLLNQ